MIVSIITRWGFHLAVGAGGRRIVNPSYLQLSESEAAAKADSSVVLDGRAPDDGPQLVDGPGSDGSSLHTSRISAADLLSGLFPSR